MIEAGVEKGAVSVDGLRVVYEVAGAGAGPAVVLIPGGFTNRSYYLPVMEHLAARRRVIAMDLRGQGESDSPAEVSLADFEKDVLAVLDATGTRSAVLCGHSASGTVALAIAARRPDLVRGVAMLDGGVTFVPQALRDEVAAGVLPALGGPQRLDVLRGFFGRTIAPTDPPEIRERVMRDLERWPAAVAGSFFADLYGDGFAARREEHSRLLAGLKCPVLYVHARVPADLALLQQLRPDLMLGQVVGSGHFLMLSAGEQVNAMLDRFLEAVDQQG